MLKLSQIVAASDADGILISFLDSHGAWDGWVFDDNDVDDVNDDDDDDDDDDADDDDIATVSAVCDVDDEDGGGDDDNDDSNLGDDNCGSGGFDGSVRRGRWHLW